MKILYVFLDETKSPGVRKKVRSKINSLNNQGIDTLGIFLNTEVKKNENNFEEKIEYVKLKIKPLSTIFNRRYLRDVKWLFETKKYNKERYRLLSEIIEKHFFDFIIMRYPLANRELLRFVKKNKNKIIFEHNSKELVELSLSKQNKVLNHIIENEKLYGPKVLGYAKAIFGVGNEVVQYEVSRTKTNQKPNCVISNGIDVDSIDIRNLPKYDGKEIRILFLTGSPSPWVGIDIVLESLANFSGKQDVKLYIVGPENEELITLSSELNLNTIVDFTGSKANDELDYYFNLCHIAFGTMAMTRVGLSEHSSLKVCEYAARGIPFVLGYDDTNFCKSKAFKPYFSKIEPKNNRIDFSQVIQFGESVMHLPNHSAEMHKIAKEELDSEVKMKKLKDFLIGLK
ncbi:glycosyltransferase [Flavobacteriales bacterium]|nr:glycosyltransferase [Flavobacteriales bacterium]